MISIVIVCHNQLESTKRCLKSIQKYSNDIPYRLFLIDNGSTDDTFEYLSTFPYETKTLIHYNENKGFVEPNNVAIQAAADDDILFLNNDIEFFSDNWLDKLNHQLYQYENIGLTYPLVQTRGQLFYGGIIEKRKESLLNYVNDKKNLKTPTWAQFCCALVKRQVFNDIGILDKLFIPAYFEDVDFCVRLVQHGYKMNLVEDIVVEHFQSVTAKTVNYDKFRFANRDKFYTKWADKF